MGVWACFSILEVSRVSLDLVLERAVGLEGLEWVLRVPVDSVVEDLLVEVADLGPWF
jgi:hypothetical protein